MILKALICLTLYAYSCISIYSPSNRLNYVVFIPDSYDYFSKSINWWQMFRTMFDYYSNPVKMYFDGPNYSLQSYHDSSQTTVLYILYQKINSLKTNRYYAYRIEQGPKAGSIYYLGKDSCQSCRAGDMPYINYQQLDVSSRKHFMKNIVNIINSANNGSYLTSNITKINYWTLPEATIYIPIIRFQNSSQLHSPILQNSKDYLILFNSILVPYTTGNIPIDYTTLNHYIQSAIKNSKIAKSNIKMFEYLNPITKDQGTYMVTFYNQTNKKYQTIIGTFIYTKYFTTQIKQVYKSTIELNETLVKYLKNSFINKNSTKLQIANEKEVHSQILDILKTLKQVQSNIYNMQYFEYPNKLRQYLFILNQSSQNKLYQVYYCSKDKQIAKRQLTGISSARNHTNSLAQIAKLKQYYHYYAYQIDIFQQKLNPSYCSYYQFCSYQQYQFQILICIKPTSNPNKNYTQNGSCFDVKIFFKDLKTNRINLYGNSTLDCSSSNFQDGKPRLQSYCPFIVAEYLLQNNNFQRIYKLISSSSVSFKNTNSQNYLIQDFNRGIYVNSSKFNLPDLYIISFMKNGFLSAFYVCQTKHGIYVYDYVENYGIKTHHIIQLKNNHR